MAKPIPTSSQIAAIEATVSDQETQQAAFTETAGLQDAVIAKATEVDTAFKDLFDWYNDKVIRKYDAEKKAINGVFVTTPVVEADILAVSANPPSGRLVPTPPTRDIVRITEFDGGNTSVATNYEQKHITDQAQVEDWLQNGFSPTPTFNPATAKTASALTSLSTTLDVTDPTNSMSFSIGQYLVIEGLVETAVIKITSVTPTGTPPPYDFTLGFSFIITPAGTIPTNSNLDNFSGFDNTERTNKIATDAAYQNVMDDLIDSLESEINKRLARLAEQISALNTNEDPDGVTDIGTANTNAQNNQTFLTNYLITTDISNTGLTSLASDRASRSSFLTTRLSQIAAAYTGQTENYYDQRYETANSRGNTQRGTLRAKSNAQSVKTDMLALASTLTGSINALNGILPS